MSRSFTAQLTVGYLGLGRMAVALYWLTLPLVVFQPLVRIGYLIHRFSTRL